MQNFDLSGDFISANRIGSGLINDSYVVSYNQAGHIVRYVAQRINRNVFRDPVALMDNIARVAQHLSDRDGGRHLTLIKARDGSDYCRDESREYWRVCPFIEGARTIDKARSGMQARESAAAFGRFQALLCDLPGPRLHETIPAFHNTVARYLRFDEVLARDEYDRARMCKPEIRKAMDFRAAAASLVGLHERGEVPERVTHNDAKISNLMFDDVSGRVVCVIDLDTVMPGLVLYDFGDLVRTMTMSVAEDEKDLTKVTMQIPRYRELVGGYLGSTIDFLTTAELENLSVAGKVITIETGLRFLTDFLAGDEYFRIQRPNHNLDRCKTQFALADSIDNQFDEMQAVLHDEVASLTGETGLQ